MRTFIAIELSPEVKRPLVRLLRDGLPRAKDVRWVTEQQLHLTLKFLGDISDDQLARVCQVAQEASRTVVPFSLQIHGLGVFPAPRNPRVLWCGVNDPESGCRRWVEAADPLLTELNIKPETRAYTPHITLGRSRSTIGANALRDVLESTELPTTDEMLVEQITVFESQLRPGGAVYKPLATIPLGE